MKTFPPGWKVAGGPTSCRVNDHSQFSLQLQGEGVKDIDFNRLAPATRARLKDGAQLDTSDVNEVVDLVFTTFVAKRNSL